jgi:hypothetical protein
MSTNEETALSVCDASRNGWTGAARVSAGNQGSVPAIEEPINLDGVAEIAKPQM